MRRAFDRLLAALVLLMGVLAAAPCLAADDLDALRGRIAEVLERHGVPGVGLALVDSRGTVWAGGVGLADTETERPVTADTLFRVGSITKSFVALAIMRLVEDGKIGLDDRLDELAPELAISNRWAQSDPVTVAQLLEHTAGFDDMRFNETWVEGNHEDTPLAEVLARNPRSRSARWRPGTRFSYANPGYTVAGYLIEKVTGQSYEDYVEQAVLRPLGMTHASLRRTAETDRALSRGHAGPDHRPIPYANLLHRPAGNLMASPAELAKLVHFWITRGETQGGRILGPESLRRIERRGTLPYPPTDADYGLGNYGDVWGPVRVRGHDGGLPGFISRFGYVPELGVGYVVLLNSTSSPFALLEIHALVLRHLVAGAELPRPPRVELPDDALAAFAGHYEYVTPRHEITRFLMKPLGGISIVIEDGELHLRPLAGGTAKLVPTGPNSFRLARQSGSSIVFVRDEANQRVMLVHGTYFQEAPEWFAKLRYRAFLGTILILQVTVLSAFLWLPGWLLGRHREQPGYFWLRALPVLAAGSLFAMYYAFLSAATIGVAGTANWRTIAVCVASWAFLVLSIVACSRAVRSLQLELPWTAKLHSLAAAVACYGFAMYLFQYGIIGLRTWAW